MVSQETLASELRVPPGESARSLKGSSKADW